MSTKCAEILDSVSTNPKEVGSVFHARKLPRLFQCKTRFFASVLKLLKTLAASDNKTIKDLLTKQALPSIVKLVSDTEIWLKELRKCAFHCQSVSLYLCYIQYA